MSVTGEQLAMLRDEGYVVFPGHRAGGPVRRGARDLLVFDSHLPHGTVRNDGASPRAVFYVQLHPRGTDAEREERLVDVATGRCPSWWRWKPGHDRLDPRRPVLTEHGQRLLGARPWPG